MQHWFERWLANRIDGAPLGGPGPVTEAQILLALTLASLVLYTLANNLT